MKKIFAIMSIAAVTLFGVSCNPDLLNLDNPNALTAETAFNSEGDIDLALTGAYHSFYSSVNALLSGIQFSGLSDETTTMSNADIIAYLGLQFPNYSFKWNNSCWKQLYEQIFRCNQVLTYAEENVTEWKKYDKTQIIAQARAIRAYDYFELAMLYGKVPYIDWVSVAGDKPAEVSYETLCAKIVEDAKFAYENLPGSYFDGSCRSEYSNQYRVTKWFAACVLGKTYMNWNHQYDKALPYYKDIVENGGFELVADFNHNFNIPNENNKESIWEIQNYAAVNASGRGAYDGWTNNSAVPDRSEWRWKFYALSPVGWNDVLPDDWTLYAFKNEKTVKDTPTTKAGQFDPRLEASLFYYGIFEDFPGHSQWGLDAQGYIDQNKAEGVEDPERTWWISKWPLDRIGINKYAAQYEDWVKVNADNCNGTNNRVFRLGEIKLDYAECLAQTGNINGAIEQIDQIRDRAGLAKLSERVPLESTYTNELTGATLDFNADYAYANFLPGKTPTLADVMSVLDIEDMKETAFECQRLFDIRRWGIADGGAYYNLVAKRSYKYKANFEPFKTWLPIPTSEVDNNENLNQNAGY